MNIKLTGKIEKIGEVQTFNSGFQKREVLLTEVEGQYPQTYPVELLKDNTELLSGKNVGDTVTVECNLRASEYNGRHFLNMVIWRVNE
jgi:single-strand DNA-binding protein